MSTKKLYAIFYILEKMPSVVIEAESEDAALDKFIDYVNHNLEKFDKLFSIIQSKKLLTRAKLPMVGTDGVIPFVVKTDINMDELMRRVEVGWEEDLKFTVTLDGIESGEIIVDKSDILLKA